MSPDTDGTFLQAPQNALVPLFAHHTRLWIRVWAATQTVAICVASYEVLDRAGGIGNFMLRPSAATALYSVFLLVAYHITGILAHEWILRRRWAVLVFVPLGWAIVVALLNTSGAFGILILGAIIQGFIFLPFAWAIATLAVVVLSLTATIIVQAHGQFSSLVLARTVGMLATGIMIGTVMLYIERMNREVAIRHRLLRQLDDAQRDLSDRARDAGVQEERQRLARDIHDTLAQGFTSVIKHLEAIELSFSAAGVPANDDVRNALPHLAHAQEVSRSSLAEIRRLVWALQPAELSAAPLTAAVERIVAQWGEANGIATTCVCETLPLFQPAADVTFLRATQESLSNVARHADATRVDVTFSIAEGLVLLAIEDNGRGFNQSDTDGTITMGLSGMRERVRRFGGHVLVESTPGTGTSVTIAVPQQFIVGRTLP